MALLQVVSITKAFAGTPVLKDVSFEAEQGEVVCLLGPSGCGKTTLLRIVAGLETADAGRVTFEGRPLEGVPVHLSLIHISEPTRLKTRSRMPSSA